MLLPSGSEFLFPNGGWSIVVHFLIIKFLLTLHAMIQRMKTSRKTLLSRTPLKSEASVFFDKNGFEDCHKVSAPKTNICPSSCFSFAVSETPLPLQISFLELECPFPLLEVLAGAMLAISFMES